MGLFDKLLKGAVDAIDNAAAKNGNGPTGLKDLFNQAMDKKDEAINGSSSTTASSKEGRPRCIRRRRYREYQAGKCLLCL